MNMISSTLKSKDMLLRDIGKCFRVLGNEGTVQVLDQIKSLGLGTSKSGVSIAINDVKVSSQKQELVLKANLKFHN